MAMIKVNSDDPKVPQGFMLLTCKSCGNTGLHRIMTSDKQEWFDYCDGEPDYMGSTQWSLLECPVCQNVSLFKSTINDYVMDVNHPQYRQEEMVYPTAKRTFPNTPEAIVKSYEAALETLRIDLNISLIAIRRVLEMICKERGCKKKTLAAMLKDMVNKRILPETLDKCGFLIRKLGNNGAHGDEDVRLNRRDLEKLLDFIETIMYYIYELPVGIEDLKIRYDIETETDESNKKDT